MKTYITLLILMISVGISAQGKDEKRDRIKALKTAYITTELDLTSDEAAKFWPIYNSYDEKQFELRHQKMRAIGKKLQTVDALNEKDALSLVNQMEEVDELLYQNKKKLIGSLKSVIGSVKILKLKKAEDDFQRKLLKQYKEKGPKK